MRAIICQNAAGYIGDKGQLMWHCPQELAHFRNMTMGSTLLCGFKTMQTLPPLHGRHVVVDNEHGLIDLDSRAIHWCIGGRKTYEKYAHLFTELHISTILDNYRIGDTPAPDWRNLSADCQIFNYEFSLYGL